MAFNPALCQPSFDQAFWPQAFVVRALKPAVAWPSAVRAFKPAACSFDQALWPQAFVVRALKPAVCLHGPLLGRSRLPFANLRTPKILCGVQACRLPAFKLKPLKSSAAASTRHSGHRHVFVRASKPAVCLHGLLLLGRSGLPFASPASIRQPGHRHLLLGAWSLPLPGPPLWGRSSLPLAASTRHSGHRHLLLEPWSLPFASMALC